jgi:hypothetical protein
MPKPKKQIYDEGNCLGGHRVVHWIGHGSVLGKGREVQIMILCHGAKKEVQPPLIRAFSLGGMDLGGIGGTTKEIKLIQ